jgi:signal transduction histidine kinase
MQNEHEVTLPIVVRHPWWNTWWAWCIYLLVAGALAWSIWKYLKRMDELRTRIKVENQLTEYKLRFYTNISHEFRTPLTIIRGAMDRINALGDVPGNLKQPISSMQKSTSRMLRLINELLEFRKIQNQQLRLSLEETDIIGFLRNIFLTFNETAENRRINYQFSTPVREYKMFIDRNYVDKMAYNLLSNALKYTPQKGSVMVRVKVGDLLQIIIEDTGVGIPREKQPELFQRFMQSVFSTDSVGIGLHLTKALVDVHHGQISFAENHPQGSVFTI